MVFQSIEVDTDHLAVAIHNRYFYKASAAVFTPHHEVVLAVALRANEARLSVSTMLGPADFGPPACKLGSSPFLQEHKASNSMRRL